MLLLTSTSDKLQVTTGSAGNIDVHASWMDNVAGAVQPGRTNSNIAAAATTDVVAAPAASVQRNVKTLHIRNRGGASNTITVQHTDGTIVSQLYRTPLAPEQTLQYIDEIGFIVPPLVLSPTSPTIQKFTSGSGTYNTPAGCRWIEVEIVGGGGAGAGGSIGGTFAGGNGGDTTFGPLTGGGGKGGFNSSPGPASSGGVATGGDVNITGEAGSANGNVADNTTFASGGEGGATPFAGRGNAGYNRVGGDAVANTGSGGGGGGNASASSSEGGYGGGAGGYARKLIFGPAATYAYSVGAGGTPATPSGASWAGGAGAAGIIIVREFY